MPGDINLYTTGVIGIQNVVLAYILYIGKFTLVFGICDGIPSGPKHKKEIYVGDVIASELLMEYDLRRQFEPEPLEGERGTGQSIVVSDFRRR
ncbi:hypothetical protein BDV38DRAFT_278850 [Aspergillus pseudotamarii]|uniref:Nucleoside phosphorylase domain-containing protein n=1 Tax=Aspergillus pseudotamarii TaxID=132259 RepID=A0A5N6T5A3_ASPPS|nr:uncharacterized protein BDV38DRAFT_278850 [Aspergillus pseudotamarii]KAE8141496.1 hypothetical protein BDV38DRAFT_278850 [Aspergillus pseudotamarii]